MRVLLAGASGLIGQALEASLLSDGHEVQVLRRDPHGPGLQWDPARGRIDLTELGPVDAVVHLGGQNLADGRWNARRKEVFRSSRVDSTRLLCRALAELPKPPPRLICASAIGIYGSRGGEVLEETSPPGQGFLAQLCEEWEQASREAEAAGIRAVQARFGIVVSPLGGALKSMLLPFRLGLGGRMGSGRQYWSWISLPDAVAALRHLMESPGLEGPVHLVSPGALPQREFARLLAARLHRPCLGHLPASILRWVLGEMAEAMLLASARVHPKRLLDDGFHFAHPDWSSYLDSSAFADRR